MSALRAPAMCGRRRSIKRAPEVWCTGVHPVRGPDRGHRTRAQDVGGRSISTMSPNQRSRKAIATTTMDAPKTPAPMRNASDLLLDWVDDDSFPPGERLVPTWRACPGSGECAGAYRGG